MAVPLLSHLADPAALTHQNLSSNPLVNIWVGPQ